VKEATIDNVIGRIDAKGEKKLSLILPISGLVNNSSQVPSCLPIPNPVSFQNLPYPIQFYSPLEIRQMHYSRAYKRAFYGRR
jgi:hypothetical protein